MSKEHSGGGIGLCVPLFLVFLVLKLCDVIDWSWWWITAPLWIPFAAGIVFLVVLLVVAVLAALIDERKKP